MLKGIHFLLTYMCNFECDHCFVYSSPSTRGTFSLQQIKTILQEAKKIGVEWVYFEGGEPFLFYPLMVEGIRIASNMGFKTGIVTNAYWATTVEDAKLWLVSLRDLGVSDISVSDDTFHYPEGKGGKRKEENLAKNAYVAARILDLPVASICIDEPDASKVVKEETSIRFRGRAADKLVQGLPRKNWKEFRECPYENLEKPERVHIDPFGNVHICQGLLMGNLSKTSFFDLVKNYDFKKHPICEPLVSGGPASLAEKYDVRHETDFVDACHFCYSIRRSLIDRFPEYLGPKEVYGLI
jgi:MoaA/NifB/PqqE/SkfB family radical SAM enzyme